MVGAARRLVRRWSWAAALLVLATVSVPACKQETVYDTVYLEISSGVTIDQIQVRVRVEEGTSRTVVDADKALGTLVVVPLGRDLSADPFVVRMEAGGAIIGVVDLQVSGLAKGKLVAAWAGKVNLALEAQIPIVLSALPDGCDGDGDGAIGCADATCCPGGLATFADCDDEAADVSPFATVLPECIPCSGAVDWLCMGEVPPCADGDGDGTADCEDCAPDDKSVGPGAIEVCGNGKDDNCDGQQDEGWTWNDAGTSRKVGEACGVGACAGGVVTCTNELRVPVCSTADQASAEVCGNAVDDDCDGATDEGCTVGDWDGDGHVEDDCRPYDAAFHPGAVEGCCDPTLGDKALALCDKDCDGEVGLCDAADHDVDGYAPPEDCDDTNAAIHPTAPEKCDDGVDQNCDGVDPACGDPGIVDGDGDQWILPGDCDDEDPAIHPGAAEACDNRDNDCDGVVDDGNPGGGGPCDPQGVPSCAAGTLVCAHVGGTGGAVGAEVQCVDYVAGEPELCNGLDDDCDGDTDEGFVWEGAPVGVSCVGTGACGAGIVECVTVEGGTAAICSTNPGGSAAQAVAEACDLVDNDCDGDTDEGLTGGSLDGCLSVGVCAQGVPATCVEGAVECGYSEVAGYEDPEATCDSQDNDCNGATDEGFTWQDVAIGEPCDGVGECGEGTVECAAGGASATCSTNPGATADQSKAETCNGKDDDCNGETDESFTYDGAALGDGCDGVGACGTGFVECAPGGASATCSTNPDGSAFVLVEELCNGKDDDCDGDTDEPFTWQGAAIGAGCDGVGECGAGTVECAPGGASATCSTNPDGSAYVAVAETCNGKDDDCDGETDEAYTWEGLALGDGCDGVGECGAGVVECRSDGTAATCSTNPDGSVHGDKAEDCNGKDDDCSGAVDDNLPTGGAAVTAAKCNTLGVCGDPANVPTCDAGKWACHPEKVPTWEATETSCDALDNDCDGQKDEGFQWSGVALGKICDGTGECGTGLVECTQDHKAATCSTNPNGSQKQATPEVCNGKDDDCDGQVDDGLPTGVDAVAAAGCKSAGVCKPELVQAACSSGAWVCGYGGVPGYEATAEKSCDGKDNDCDGLTDDEFTWQGLAKGDACDGTGVCGAGTVVCDITGAKATCSTNPDTSTGTSGAVTENCNGEDDDCDGVVDNNLPTGAAAVAAAKCNTKGVCLQQGAPTCGGGAWTCHYEQAPGFEAGSESSCDGKDNDCDGSSDEEFAWQGKIVGAACDGTGECGVGVVQCKDAASATCSTNPDGTAYVAVAEVCNGKDDDCDGSVDEDWPDLKTPCDGPDADLCAEGLVICAPGGAGSMCSDDSEDSEELCDEVDNDCDGEVDETFLDKNMACDGDDQDLCEDGTFVCDASGLGVQCDEPGPNQDEVCDGVDNDCDGLADEGFFVGDPCQAPDNDLDTDKCPEAGTLGCDPGTQTAMCLGVVNSSVTETCNGKDDDCDGSIDEDWPTLGTKCDGPVGDGCATGVWACGTGAEILVCKGDAMCAVGTTCSVDANGPDHCLCDTTPCDGRQGDSCVPASGLCKCGSGAACDGVSEVCVASECVLTGGNGP